MAKPGPSLSGGKRGCSGDSNGERGAYSWSDETRRSIKGTHRKSGETTFDNAPHPAAAINGGCENMIDETPECEQLADQAANGHFGEELGRRAVSLSPSVQ